MNDYPSDGDAIGIYDTPEDKQQKKAAQVELNSVAASYPIVKEVIEWFAEQVEAAGNIRNIDLESKVSVDSQVIAYRHLAELLNTKGQEFQTKFEAWKRDQEADNAA